VTGTIGDAGLGLRIARGEMAGPDRLVHAYRRPEPRLAAGRALASLAHATADVSDGLLIDASRIAAATAGDDYELLLTAPESAREAILAVSASLGIGIAPIGRCTAGAGLTLFDRKGNVPLPLSLGYEHRG
jgi:thiamine-monophosphate kinase